MYTDSDFAADCSPLSGLVSDESRFVLPAEEASRWYLVRLELLCLDVGRVVLRPGNALMSNSGPLQFNSTVILSHRRAPAVGSVCAMSDDRRFLEEQLKILEEQVNGIVQPSTADHNNGVAAGGGLGGGSGTNGRYAEGAETEGSPEEEAGDYSHSGTDWDPDTHTSTDSELEGDRRRLAKHVKREYSGKKAKPRGPSLRAELTHKRHPAAAAAVAAMRSYSRISKESPSPSFKFNTLRASDFQSFGPALGAKDAPAQPCATMTFDQQSQTEASSDDAHSIRTLVAILQEEVSRQGQTISEMQAKMQYMQNAMGVSADLFDMKYEVREEVVASEASRALPPLGAGVPRRPPAAVLGNMNRSARSERRYPPLREEHTSNSFGSEAETDYSADMVAIGSGKTMVPRAIYSQINWHSYTIATRKLLMAVFPRRTLATHSLTGKASPAFTSKPAKLRLDMKKVTDIVITVADNCGVREGLVRSCITTKCADENKMYRMRLEKKAKKAKKSIEDESNNQENTPPPQGIKKSELMDQQYQATPLSAPRQG